VLSALAHVAALQHDFELARAQAEESRARALATGDVQTVAGALAVLGSAAFATGDIAGARARFREILSLERELEDTRARALPLAYLGVLALLEGDRTAGRALVEESLALLYEVDDRRTAAMALSYLVRLAWPDGDERLLRRLEEWLTLCRELRDDAAAARALMILGNVVERDGDLERAEAAYEESLLLCLHRPQDTLTIAGSLAGLAEISATQDSSDRTARLFGAARAALERVNAHESPADQIDRSRIGAIVRAGQLVHGREAEWAAGRSMTARQALAYVLR
jgi:hypothetical protein